MNKRYIAYIFIIFTMNDKSVKINEKKERLFSLDIK